MRLVDQLPAISGAIEYRSLAPGRRDRFVVAKYAFPGRSRVRRFDQGVGKIAQLPFVVGELELRCAQADAARRLGADPSMHVVADEIPAGAAEIATAASAKHHAN